MICFQKKWISDNAYPLFLCLIFSFFSKISYSQDSWTFDKSEHGAYQKILSLKIVDANLELSRDRNATKYLLHLKSSIEMLISDNELALDAYDKNTDQVLTHFKKQKENSPYLKFYTAEILLQSAFVHLKLGHEMSASWELRKAYKEIKRNMKSYPDFLPQYKTIGLLHIIIGSVPDKYNWLLSILGMEGSVREGMQLLSTLANSKNLFSQEAQLLTLLMKAYILDEARESVAGLRQLYEDDDQNILIGYLYVSVLMKNHNNATALKTLQSIKKINNSEYIPFPLLAYVESEALLQKGDYNEAIGSYQQFIKNHLGQNYLKDANYKIGLAYFILNQTEVTEEYFQTARGIGTTLTEVDQHASKQLDINEYPNRLIMKARLLTDGGYYDDALRILENIRPTQLTKKIDHVEHHYRKARVYHKTNQINMAIAFYKLTINSGEKNGWYFAPNASLQLGYIYRAEQNSYLAEKYFNKALSYKDHEYKNSIDNKAKLGLDSLPKN